MITTGNNWLLTLFTFLILSAITNCKNSISIEDGKTQLKEEYADIFFRVETPKERLNLGPNPLLSFKPVGDKILTVSYS